MRQCRAGLYLFISVQLLFSTILFSQVKIKEKIELRKDNLISNSVKKSAGGDNIVSVNLTWDRGGREGSIMFIENCNNGRYTSGWLTGGSLNLEKNYTVGSFPIVRVGLNLGSDEPTNFSYTIKYNGVNVYDGSGRIEGGLWTYDAEVPMVFCSSANLSLSPNTNCGCGGTASSRVYISAGSDCTSPSLFNPTFDKINLSIIENAEYMSFFDEEIKNNLGTAISKSLNEVNLIRIKQIKPNLTPSDIKVIIKSDASGIISKDSIMLKSEVNKHGVEFYSMYGLDYMLAGERQPLLINLYSSNNCQLPDSLNLKAEIIKGSGYLLDNPATGESGTVLNNIRFKGNNGIIYVDSKNIVITSTDTVKIKISTGAPYNISSVFSLPVRPQNMKVSFDKKALSRGGTTNVILQKIVSADNYASFSTGQLFTIQLMEEDEWGSIYSASTGSSDRFFTDTPEPFVLRGALSINPDSVKLLVRVNTIDNNVELAGSRYITLHKKDYFIKSYFSKQPLLPKDTVNIIVKKSDLNGIETDLPDTTHYEVLFKDGCGYGNILTSDGRLGKYFNGLVKPLRFVVSDTIKVDSAVIKLRVGVTSNNSISSSVVSMNKGKTTVKKAAMQVRNKAEQSDESYCSSQTPQLSEFGIAEGTISNTVLKILYPLAVSKDEEITKEPKMPEVLCKAQLNNYKGGQVTFEWEYWLSYIFKRYHKNESDTLSSRTGKISFKGISKTINDNISVWKVPFVKDSIKSVKLTATTPVDNYYKFKDKTQRYPGDDNEVITEWLHGNDVFTGGYVYVSVTAKDSKGKILGTDAIKANKLIGHNPDKNDVVVAAGTNEMRAVLIHESKYSQFRNGWPKYGYPNGYGLMQLDNSPAATELQLWNWKENLNGGIEKFNVYKKEFEKALKKHPDPDGFVIKLKQIYRKYNSNHDFYIYEKDKWVFDPNIAYKDEETNEMVYYDAAGYANTVYEIYLELVNQ